MPHGLQVMKVLLVLLLLLMLMLLLMLQRQGRPRCVRAGSVRIW
jgi:hypothetical protein